VRPVLAFLLAAAPLLAQVTPKWEHNLDAALKRAKAEKKQVFVDVWAEWCPPCQHLKNNVFPSPEAGAALSKVVPASLMVQTKDGKNQPEAAAAAKRFNVEGFPTLVVLDANGKEVRRHVGAFRTGTDLANWLDGK
jgi:thiol:disulfide interchange protein